MKKRLVRFAKLLAYPLFYLFSLALFGYLTFPYDQLKGRIISEFDRVQLKSKRRRGGQAPMRLEIAELDSYWGTGVEVTGARLIIPPKANRTTRRRGLSKAGGAAGTKDAGPPKPTVVAVDRLVARVQVMPLLVGKVVIKFSAEAFGGEIEGTVPWGHPGEVDVELDGLQLIDIQPLQGVLEGVPLQGVASGTLQLTPKEGKFAKADGKMSIAIDGVKLGKVQKGEDGKPQDVVEIQGFTLPAVALGQLNIEATAKDGTLKLDELATQSADFELLGEGRVKLHESWERSGADFYLKFKFSDAYRGKSDAASSLLGKPGAKFAPAIEIAPGSPFKRAKTDDGYYQFHVHGALSDLKFDPAANKGARRPRAGRGKKASGKGFKAPTKISKKRPKPRTPPPKEEGVDKEPPAPPPKEDAPGPPPKEESGDKEETEPDAKEAAPKEGKADEGPSGEEDGSGGGG